MTRLPDPPTPDADASVLGYGLSLFRWVLATGITATLSAQQIEWALHASTVAVSARDEAITPATRETYRRMRHRLYAALDVARRPTTEPATGPAPAVDDTEPGTREPARPYPVTSPSQGLAVAIDW